MEQEQILSVSAPLKKIYRPNAIYVATLLGGPLAAGYMAFQNFRVFGDRVKANYSLGIGILSSILVLSLGFLLMQNGESHARFIYLSYMAGIYYAIKHFQGSLIESHIYEGGPLYSWGRSLLIGLISLAILFVSAFWIGFLSALTDSNN